VSSSQVVTIGDSVVAFLVVVHQLKTQLSQAHIQLVKSDNIFCNRFFLSHSVVVSQVQVSQVQAISLTCFLNHSSLSGAGSIKVGCDLLVQFIVWSGVCGLSAQYNSLLVNGQAQYNSLLVLYGQVWTLSTAVLRFIFLCLSFVTQGI